jgi:hypothetical protein
MLHDLMVAAMELQKLYGGRMWSYDYFIVVMVTTEF